MKSLHKSHAVRFAALAIAAFMTLVGVSELVKGRLLSAEARGSEGNSSVALPVLTSSGKASPFGLMGLARPEEAMPYIKDLGFGWLRLAQVDWDRFEPTPGEYRWGMGDRFSALVKKEIPRVQLLCTIRAVNPWAVPQENNSEMLSRAAGKPENLKDYYRFVYQLVKHFSSDINYWQIENEMETLPMWKDDAGAYLELLKTGYRAAKDANPSCVILLGGFIDRTINMHLGKVNPSEEVVGDWSPLTQKQRLERSAKFAQTVLDKGSAYFDIVDLHAYGPYTEIPELVQWLKNAMKRNGYQKPIWATEISGPTENYSEQRQAEEAVKRTILALSEGVEKVFWFSLFDADTKQERFRKLGLTTKDLRKKPAYFTYRYMTHQMDGCRFVQKLKAGPGVQAFLFRSVGDGAKGAPGRRVAVLWSDAGGSVQIPAMGKEVTVTDSVGKSLQTAPSNTAKITLKVGSSPIYVEQT